MNFLKQFWTVLNGFLFKGSTDALSENELLSRYLTSKSHFSRDKNIVKSSAFMPPSDLNLSVFRIGGLTDEEIWEIGGKEVINKSTPPRTLYGRAEITTATVKENNLGLVPDNTPPRHVNITDWPIEKSERKMIAVELANKATLKLCI